MHKKIISGILICLLLAVGIGGFALYHAADETPLRLHVIANSDTPYDQEVKLFVRDQIFDLLSDSMEGVDNKDEAMASLEEALPQIEERCNQVLADLAPYGAVAKLEVAEFPTRRYGDLVLPAGEYDALRVVLGEGEGRNWWCVLFPPLCLVDLAKDVEVTASPKSDNESVPVSGSQVKIKMKWNLFNNN